MRKFLCVLLTLGLFCGCCQAGDGWKANLKRKTLKLFGIPEKSNGAADIMHGYEQGTLKYNLKAFVSVLSPTMLFFRVVFHEVRKDLQDNYWIKGVRK